MSKLTLTHDDFVRAAASLDCDVAAIKAVDWVESRGAGFLPDGQPIILFERHVFHRLTDGAWTYQLDPKTNRYLYNDISWPAAGSYGAEGQHQHDKLARAVALDRDAALMSASWGRFQLMGFNFNSCGFYTLQSFINAMYESEQAQLDAFVQFLKSQQLDVPLKEHEWTTFAARYNGKDYRKNRYHQKLPAAWRKFNKENTNEQPTV